jgi:hypothetical protein
VFQRPVALLRFLLECMDNPDFICDLDSIDHAKRIATKFQGNLKDARTEAVQRFRNVCLFALRRDRERCQEGGLRTPWKALKVLQCRFDYETGRLLLASATLLYVVISDNILSTGSTGSSP